jgi:acetate CoA/acetoacetate CoA-transferase alpha subunit
MAEASGFVRGANLSHGGHDEILLIRGHRRKERQRDQPLPLTRGQRVEADFALVQAFLADYLGNLSYALTARNFNPVIAMAADTVIASADNIVPVGVMSPDHVVTPAPVVDYLVAN